MIARQEPLTGPMTPGAQSRILPDGLATIPQDAPAAVQRAIAAGNRIIHTFYSQERRAGMLAHVEDSYDCSGASDYILYQAGLSDPTVDVGDAVAGTGITIESYGQPGPGRWITVFGSSAHEFIKVDNIVMDTAHYAPVQPSSVPDPYPPDDPTNGGPASGPRWQPASIIPSQLDDGNTVGAAPPSGPVMRSARLTLCSLVASSASPQRRPAAASQHTDSVRTAVPRRCRQQQHDRAENRRRPRLAAWCGRSPRATAVISMVGFPATALADATPSRASAGRRADPSRLSGGQP